MSIFYISGPINLNNVKNIFQKISVPAQVSLSPPDPSRYCSHHNSIAAMSSYENTPGINRKIHHVHNPIIPKKGVRKPRKKKVYANLMLSQQMIEAKEAEARRINEVNKSTK